MKKHPNLLAFKAGTECKTPQTRTERLFCSSSLRPAACLLDRACAGYWSRPQDCFHRIRMNSNFADRESPVLSYSVAENGGGRQCLVTHKPVTNVIPIESRPNERTLMHVVGRGS